VCALSLQVRGLAIAYLILHGYKEYPAA